MRPADTAAVARLERAIFGREAWPATAFAYVRAVFTAARPARGQLWIAETAGGQLVGYTGIELSVLGGEADVINLAVDPAHRRQGVGRSLLATATGFCRARGIPIVWLRVRAGNDVARAFYRRSGFRSVGRFRDYYDDPREDAVLMELRPSTRPRLTERHR
jgi:ribosomal-protein-alanine N-acetyltransferase